MNNSDILLGTGWSFPPAFDRSRSEVDMTTGIEDIQNSLKIIFTTLLGERLMNPTFGCSMEEMVFEPMTTSRIAYLKNLIETAILYHEPRIDADDVEIRPEPLEGILWIHIGYRVRTINSRFNFVYPFYLKEANA